MNATDVIPTHSLQRGQLLEIADAGATDVQCLRGCLWITVDHDLRDTVLEPGDSFRAGVRRRALVYALQPSELVVRPAQKARPATVSCCKAGARASDLALAAAVIP